MTEDATQSADAGQTEKKAEKVEAVIRDERDRIVAALRRLADRIESAPLDRVSSGIAWIATAAETLVRTVERALGTKK
jgi:hypothetical protein